MPDTTDQRGFELVRDDLAEPLPDLGSFDAVVSCFAIHHVPDTRKRLVYAEAASSDGQSGTATVSYTVAAPPTAQISSPTGSGTYAVQRDLRGRAGRREELLVHGRRVRSRHLLVTNRKPTIPSPQDRVAPNPH